MNGGIDQLVNTYKGNPQPLAQKVQQGQQQMQQGQSPVAIPPDLEEAIALQKISEMRQGAQNQQAMQAGGAQPSVVEKLRQMLGNMQQQSQPMPQGPQGQPQGQSPMPQGQPVMAAHGGSIDQLVSNLGRHYAGGGIIAFSTGNKVKDTEEEKKARQREEDRRALLEPLAAAGDIFQLPLAAGYNLVADTGSGIESFLNRVGSALTGENINTQNDKQIGGKFRFSPTPFTDMLRKPEKPPSGGRMNMVNDPRLDPNYDMTPTGPGAAKPAPAPAPTPRPTVNTAVPSGGPAKPVIPAKPAEEAMSPMETALQKSIMDAMAKDPEVVRKEAMEQNAQFMGLDALLKPAQDRVTAREARIKQIQEERTPEWVKGLQRAGRARPGSGVGALLGELGAGTSEARETYSAENLKFLDELNKLNSEIDKAKIEGRYKDVAAGKEAVKDLIADRRQAEQSGTSLLNTKAINKSREQTAKDAAAGRAQVAAGQAQTAALAREERTRQFNEEQLRKIRQNDVDRATKIEAAIGKRTGMIDLQLQQLGITPEKETELLKKRDTIVKQVMKEYPSAKSEGAKFLGFEPSTKS